MKALVILGLAALVWNPVKAETPGEAFCVESTDLTISWTAMSEAEALASVHQASPLLRAVLIADSGAVFKSTYDGVNDDGLKMMLANRKLRPIVYDLIFNACHQAWVEEASK